MRKKYLIKLLRVIRTNRNQSVSHKLMLLNTIKTIILMPILTLEILLVNVSNLRQVGVISGLGFLHLLKIFQPFLCINCNQKRPRGRYKKEIVILFN